MYHVSLCGLWLQTIRQEYSAIGELLCGSFHGTVNDWLFKIIEDKEQNRVKEFLNNEDTTNKKNAVYYRVPPKGSNNYDKKTTSMFVIQKKVPDTIIYRRERGYNGK